MYVNRKALLQSVTEFWPSIANKIAGGEIPLDDTLARILKEDLLCVAAVLNGTAEGE